MLTLQDLLVKYINVSDPSLYMGTIPILDIGDRMGMTQYIDFIKYEDLSDRVMYGYDKYGRIFLAIRYEVYNLVTKHSSKMAISIFQRYTDDIHTITNGTCYPQNNIFEDRLMNTEYWSCVKDLIEVGSYIKDVTYKCV